MSAPLSDEQQALLKTIDEELQILVLVTGTLPGGSDHYAYASIPPSRYMEFKQAEAAGNYDLAQFGKILAHGEGKEPPAEVVQRMEQEHGVNHRFEEEIQQWVQQMQNAARKSGSDA